MGRALVTGLNAAAGLGATDDLELAGVWEREGADGVGQTYPPHPTLTLQAGPNGLEGQLDVVIDFTGPEATLRHVAWCREHGVAIVIGTTGLTESIHATLDQAARDIALVQAPNMSIGVNALFALVADAARMLGPAYDLEVVETHHNRKKDAPSGTAMQLLRELQSVRTESHGCFERYGQIGARKPDEIGMQTLRGGDVVGEHTVFYFGAGERLELTHRATDRGIFATGALRAAGWVAGKPAGRYDMGDVLRG